MQFAPSTLKALGTDTRRIVIVGANGWIGRATLALLTAALGKDQALQRVVCFGSQLRMVEVEPGLSFPQQALADLPALTPEPSLLLHLAFLTKDKVGAMDDAEYTRINRFLSQQVLDALGSIGVDRLFVASSGAAAFADDTAAAHDLRLYGGLKRDDENAFALWAEADPAKRRAVITRIFNISGPYINKHGTYALASFILDAIAGRPIHVRAPMRVMRGYVAVRELLSLVFFALLADDGDAVLRFDSGGEPLELGEVAEQVAQALGGGSVNRAPITHPADNVYIGNDESYQNLLARSAITPVSLHDQIVETAHFLAQVSQAAAVRGD